MSSEAPTKSTAPTNEVGVMSSPTVAPSEPRETSTAVIEQGKRFNALSQYEDAVDAFSKAVEILYLFSSPLLTQRSKANEMI